jgi:hypothetical protein
MKFRQAVPSLGLFKIGLFCGRRDVLDLRSVAVQLVQLDVLTEAPLKVQCVARLKLGP